MPRLLVLILFIYCSASVSAPADDPALEAQARALARQFVSELKPQLKQAMNEGGPGNAIEVCASVAPRIADRLSAESGWLVRRVSLKSRNASRGQPDAWENSVLHEFNQRQRRGEKAATLNYSAMDGKRYRYMQAQVVEPLCLVCHGKGLSESVQDTLGQYYPDDWATGYSLGEIRGAISLARDPE